MSKIYTFEQVAEHNTPQDAWLIIDGKVYDVTAFVEEHPGGDEIVLDLAGQDGTEAFNDIGHSEDAVAMLKDLLVGSLDPASMPAKSEKIASVGQNATTGGEGSGKLALACALVFFAVAYYVANMR
ncbi:CYB5 (YNL111C) [Zygosaccharomyces parabailii]|nr:CYB5 (YNL111C) [Zygosaccharomyces parabailii]AQZ18082.1 CYB5 (YNL111C) [Zygosaccharomyces parabailii]CDH11111.1 related to Cytochrome b5 [Zygosaccharomyces bailii ISA1307]CDH17368.1 related to Cytochrome b5 [Zygosaccharomyces bailii ISA1307]SJM86515.1 related to Cytochrome b5 [Zygosaccharomyces bailii]